MGVEHHLLALARVELNQKHPAMAKTHVRRLDLGRRAHQNRVLMAPVEPVDLGRSSAARGLATAIVTRAARATPWHTAAPRRSHRHSPATQVLRKSATPTDKPAAPSPHWLPGDAPPPQPTDPASASAEPRARSRTMSRRSAIPCKPRSGKPSNPELIFSIATPLPKCSQQISCDRLHNQHLPPSSCVQSTRQVLATPSWRVNLERQLPPQEGQYSTRITARPPKPFPGPKTPRTGAETETGNTLL